MAKAKHKWRNLPAALGFLAPNIIGVLAFTVLPVAFAIVMAFTNWDLKLHNMFQDNPLKFVGLDNFIRLIFGTKENLGRFWTWITGGTLANPNEPIIAGDFLKYLGNTLFLMMAIPFSVGGSLLAAILLSKDMRGGRRIWAWLVSSAVMMVSVSVLCILGMGATGMVILLVGVVCGILLMGTSGGTTVYRTLFYMPYFVQGVPTFILWKKLYNPQTGPVNTALRPVLDGVGQTVRAAPNPLIEAGMWVCFILMGLLLGWGLAKLRRFWRDGDLGTRAAVMPVVILFLPWIVAWFWSQTAPWSWWLLGVVVVAVGWQLWRLRRDGRDFKPPSSMEGVGSGLVLSLAVMAAMFVLLGVGAVFWNLPAMVGSGAGGTSNSASLKPPQWIHDYQWAKPSLMLMMLWGAIGSNNMLLYLAALTNVPKDLYEAAEIDGAGRFQKFWNVTWPQLAPTTFFIAVMSTIGGLQGGFEMARVMTQGGPAGATTTLSYFIYIEGFQTGRLGFSSAVAWSLFLLVFALTMFNWKFGNKYVNE